MKNIQKTKQNKTELRRHRVRSAMLARPVWPRLSVFRSLKHFYLQIIDDKQGKTICAASDFEISKKKGLKPVDAARAAGEAIAKKALAKGVEKVVFDRGAYKFHGQVKAAAEGAREGGLKF